MKKIEIYLNDELVLTMLVDDYEMDSYSDTIDIRCKIKGLEIAYSLPINKGYKIVADI